MAHPYRDAAHKSDPNWLRGIKPFVEKHGQDDIDAVIRNYGGSKSANEDAGYPVYEEKK